MKKKNPKSRGGRKGRKEGRRKEGRRKEGMKKEERKEGIERKKKERKKEGRKKERKKERRKEGRKEVYIIFFIMKLLYLRNREIKYDHLLLYLYLGINTTRPQLPYLFFFNKTKHKKQEAIYL